MDEAGEHVPGVEEEDAADEVEDVGRGQRDDQAEEVLVREEQTEGEAVAAGDLDLHGADRDEDRGEEEVAVR